MPRIAREPVRWPSWRYGPNGEKQIFNYESEVPLGWTKKPGQVFVPTEGQLLDRDVLVAQLEAKGITVNPIWGKAHLKKVLDDSCTSR